MKRTTFSVVFFCKKTKLTKKGTAPIYARITTSGRSTEIYTQCRIEPEHWNQRLERCMLRDPVSTQINGILATYRTNILAAYDSLIKEGKTLDCFAIKHRLEHAAASSRMFLAEFSGYCDKRQKEVGIRLTQLTANKYHRLLRYMTEYTREQYRKDDLPLDAIDYAYIDGLNTFMQTAHNCRNNGAVNLLCCLKNFILYAIRNEWIEKNPYDEGQGWGKVPWSQKEMELTDEIVESAKGADAAIVVVGRTAGEDQDNKNEAGSYLLTDTEKEMVEKVSKAFARTIVVLNVGNIIDMKWVKECNPAAVLYVWQGGQEGGNGVADVLMGRVSPCGKLTDTIAENIEDYPSQSCFGDLTRNEYKEDIYVGYRYFETFAKEKVLYPFGFGLSYTTFAVTAEAKEKDVDNVTVTATVENTGKTDGKEVVQVYVKAPQGVLGKPSRALVGFAKTGVLAPGAKETLTIDVTKESFASYDDSGATGHKSCYVLEEGSYEFYVGSDVRSAAFAGAYEQPFKVVEILTEAMAPVEAFERMKAVPGEDGTLKPGYEAAPLRTVDPIERMKENRMEPITYTGDKGYKLGDVLDKKVTMEEFVAQLSDEDLICIFRGEGMCSPKVTPGTAAAFGGLTPELQEFGIPAACCTDGPSGLRFDCGTRAFSMPNGTLLGCTFDLPLVEDLYEMAGREMRQNRVDALLGPGMNIHRNPLNGRNFEYISEDPYLTGWISAVQILGMEKSDVTGTIKHFCANNQESNRHHVDAVVSERALREIYLKGYEIAVKEGGARSIMSTYGPVNGIWTAGNYDLLTTILRGEWNYDGFVMTDWWAMSNREGYEATKTTHAPMVSAGNDVFMVCTDCSDMGQDDVKEALENGEITRGDLQRNAMNVLHFILGTPSILRFLDRISEEEKEAQEQMGDNDFVAADLVTYEADPATGDVVIDASAWNTKKGNSEVCGVTILADKMGTYDIEIEMKSDLEDLAQLPVTVYIDNIVKTMISIRGTKGEWIKETRDLGFFFGPNHYLKLYFGANGLELGKIRLKLREGMEVLSKHEE